VFGTPAVLEDPGAVLVWTPLDQPGAGLEVHQRPLDGDAVVADLHVVIEPLDGGRPVELHGVGALVLVGDDVAEGVALAFLQVREVTRLEGDEFDRPAFVTEKANLCNRIRAGFPLVDEFDDEVDPLLGRVNVGNGVLAGVFRGELSVVDIVVGLDIFPHRAFGLLNRYAHFVIGIQSLLYVTRQ